MLKVVFEKSGGVHVSLHTAKVLEAGFLFLTVVDRWDLPLPCSCFTLHLKAQFFQPHIFVLSIRDHGTGVSARYTDADVDRILLVDVRALDAESVMDQCASRGAFGRAGDIHQVFRRLFCDRSGAWAGALTLYATGLVAQCSSLCNGNCWGIASIDVSNLWDLCARYPRRSVRWAILQHIFAPIELLQGGQADRPRWYFFALAFLGFFLTGQVRCN